MIGFRSFLIEGVDRAHLNRSSQSAGSRVSSMQVCHSKGMWNFIGLSFCKHKLFVSSGVNVKLVHEIKVDTFTLIPSHLCHFNAPIPSH
jgi:hypothetical protein